LCELLEAGGGVVRVERVLAPEEGPVRLASEGEHEALRTGCSVGADERSVGSLERHSDEHTDVEGVEVAARGVATRAEVHESASQLIRRGYDGIPTVSPGNDGVEAAAPARTD